MFRSRPVPGTGRRWVVEDEDPQGRGLGELILDPAVAPRPICPLSRSGSVESTETIRDVVDAQNRVARAEELLEMQRTPRSASRGCPE